MSAEQHNIGAFLQAEPLFPPAAVLTRSSNGSTEESGRVIDRLALGRHYLSCQIVIAYGGNTQSSLGLLLRGNLKDGATTSAFSTFGTTSTGLDRTTATTTTATSTAHTGVAAWNYDLRTARRYLQFDLLPVLVASSSGAITFNGAAVFGGPDERPASVTVRDRIA
jgi:hypothetical protein